MLGKFKAEIASRLTDEPELTIRPYFLPKIVLIFFSNSLTLILSK